MLRPRAGSEAHLRVVRFWMQHYFRLAATHARASVMAFEPLLSATAAAHPLAARPGAPQKAVDACAAVIAPKLQQALVTAMSASAALGLLPCCLAALRASVAGPSTPSSPALHVACDLLAAADQAPPQLHAALLLALPEPLLAAAAPLLGRLAPVPSAGALPERLAAAWAHASTAAVAHAAGEAASTDATPTEPWEAAQRVLFRAAVTPLPGAAAVVAAVWTAVLSAAGPAVRSSHLALLSQSLLSLSASACAAFGGPRSSAACASAAQVATVIAALASAAPAPRGALTSVLNHLLPNATAGTGAAAAHCAPAAASSAPRDRRGVSHQPHCLFALATLLEEPGAPLGDLDEKELRGLGEILAAAASDQDEDPDTRRQALRSIRAMLRRAGSDVQGGRMQQRAERDGARCVAAAVRAIEGGGSGETPGGDLGAALRTVTAGVRVGARSETATIDGAWGLEECVARPEGMVAAVEAAGSGCVCRDVSGVLWRTCKLGALPTTTRDYGSAAASPRSTRARNAPFTAFAHSLVCILDAGAPCPTTRLSKCFRELSGKAAGRTRPCATSRCYPRWSGGGALDRVSRTPCPRASSRGLTQGPSAGRLRRTSSGRRGRTRKER